jgi:hypothetical protein
VVVVTEGDSKGKGVPMPKNTLDKQRLSENKAPQISELKTIYGSELSASHSSAFT